MDDYMEFVWMIISHLYGKMFYLQVEGFVIAPYFFALALQPTMHLEKCYRDERNEAATAVG